MLPGSMLTATIAALALRAQAQYGFGGTEAYYGAGAAGYIGSGYGNMGYGNMGYAGAGYAGVGYPGMGYSNMGYYGANMGGMSSPLAYGNAGGYIPTGMGHGIIQGASTSGAIIQGPSGTIIAAPQSAGSIVF
ncbi:hypothetical protein GGH94_003549 [Coemansia aciculifera]|uniref:Uncharacterized protein n=1 Tax=Coemansia aciculifera TaxID=417176 RepID=A0A9W8ILZ7_9FUNG|nr:hypothetical protein GGH94_003549 [Coemansia aciculifera]KAJ2873145.1 hypothetical protein GGH93_003448 [Coemansia aciculifera]